MKKLLIVLAFLSMSVFSHILPYHGTHDEIRDAIIDSLKKHDLKCVNLINQKQYDASKLRIVEIFSKDYDLVVSSDYSQPVITMSHQIKDQAKYLMYVSTDSEYKRVTKLRAKFYKNLRKEIVNVGTILNPSFEEIIIDGNPSEDLICE